MGGRGTSSYSSNSPIRGVVVMSEDDFLARKGVGDVLSGYMDDKTRLPHGESFRQREKRLKESEKAISTHAEARKAARTEYRALVQSGKVRPPTPTERALKTAQGRSENKAVQAARRMLTKRGIDWKTGGKL